MAHRARLSGSQTRGRARAFRRARLAWLPPPRYAVHRGLRIPGLREGDDSPLGISFRQAVDPEAPPLRPERHIPNSIATMRRRLIVAIARNLSRCPCCIRQSKGACPTSRCSILCESDSTLGDQQVFSPLEYRSDAASATEFAGLRAESPCLTDYRLTG